jgi:hypothetical protein
VLAPDFGAGRAFAANGTPLAVLTDAESSTPGEMVGGPGVEGQSGAPSSVALDRG